MTIALAEAGRIVDEAIERTGIDDVGNDWFLRPLAAFAADLSHPNLNELGRPFLRSRAVREVVRRLRVLETLRAHPEIEDVVIPPIVYITGLERSGTTFLHNLLALHRDARVLQRWELLEPVPPPETATYDSDARIARVQQGSEVLRGSVLEQMHWVNATDPEECVCGFVDGVSMLAWAASACVPTWGRFLEEEDLTPAFETYRRVVQLLLWKHPVGPDGFLVLKAPQVSRQIAAFAGVFPEARFVITDRDPYRCIVSLAALGHGIAQAFCEVNPFDDDGRRSRLAARPVPAKLASVAAFTADAPSRVVHVAYPELVHDPVAVVQRALAPNRPDHDLPATVLAYVDRLRGGDRAAPPETLDPRGYEAASIWSDPVIRSYCERFAIEPETTRLTGAAADATMTTEQDGAGG